MVLLDRKYLLDSPGLGLFLILKSFSYQKLLSRHLFVEPTPPGGVRLGEQVLPGA
jgi:hypothetical protein